jgi:hypothetical protein
MAKNDDLRELLGFDAEDNNNFEQYLKDKEKTWHKPASEMATIATGRQEEANDDWTPRSSVNVVPGSSDGTSDLKVEKASDATSDGPGSAPVVDEFAVDYDLCAPIRASEPIPPTPDVQATELNIRGRAGYQYITETVSPAQVSEEWKKAFTQSYTISVTKMTPEDVITRFHKLDRAIALIKATQQGLRRGLEDLLAATSAAERNRILELDKQLSAKTKRRTADPEAAKTKAKDKAASVSAKKKYAKAITKAVDTYIEVMGFSREQVIDKMKSLGKLDAETQSYIDDVFSRK